MSSVEFAGVSTSLGTDDKKLLEKEQGDICLVGSFNEVSAMQSYFAYFPERNFSVLIYTMKVIWRNERNKELYLLARFWAMHSPRGVTKQISSASFSFVDLEYCLSLFDFVLLAVLYPHAKRCIGQLQPPSKLQNINTYFCSWAGISFNPKIWEQHFNFTYAGCMDAR